MDQEQRKLRVNQVKQIQGQADDDREQIKAGWHPKTGPNEFITQREFLLEEVSLLKEDVGHAHDENKTLKRRITVLEAEQKVVTGEVQTLRAVLNEIHALVAGAT